MTTLNDFLPPMFGIAPSITCGRVGCRQPATRHIIWTAEIENGLVCDEHMAEARRLWVFYAEHEYDAGFCSHPRAGYDFEQNACAIPLDEVDWDAHVAAELELPGGPAALTRFGLAGG